MKPEIPAAFFGVAIADLRKAKGIRAVDKQRRRLDRMLRKYRTHPDVMLYAEQAKQENADG